MDEDRANSPQMKSHRDGDSMVGFIKDIARYSLYSLYIQSALCKTNIVENLIKACKWA